MDALPPFYDDLDRCLAELWRCLEAGVGDRRSAFHTPTLATIDADGRPRARTVVLRDVDSVAGTLRFQCDRRSRKAAEIAAGGRAALHAYDPAAKIQIRVEGSARLHTDGGLADAAWASAQAMSRVCYGIAPGPGTTLVHGGGYTLPSDGEELAAGRENFAAVVVQAERLDFLFLDRRGHRRAAWSRRGEVWPGGWLTP